MAAGILSAARQNVRGLRPLNLRRDLGDVADLIELCFADTLDAPGRAAIQEMRTLSRTGPLLWLLARLNHPLPLMRGYVWLEDGHVVGNVSLAPAGFGRGWIVANVAVAPTYRRHGIARRLMEAALEQVERQGEFATLQVDEDNDTARRLYESLGFTTQRAFVRWRRPGYLNRPPAQPDLPHIRRLTRRDADALYALAQRVRPDQYGGLGWLRPTTRQALRSPATGSLRGLLSGQQIDTWVIDGARRHLDALLRTERRLGGSTTTFDMLVDPARQGDLERPLLNFLLRDAQGPHQPFATDHPADDQAGGAALREAGFWQERALVHMIWPVPPK